MKTLTQHLAQYAAYHRDTRNIFTHFIGIPMIVLAVATLLSRPNWSGVTPALLLTLFSCVFYLRLEIRLGLVMSALLGLNLWFGYAMAALPTAAWLSVGLGLFAVGWIIQFVGHHYEGRKPAFVDDISGLIIGPLFVVVEAGFLLGWRPELKRQMEGAASA
ncbi:Mpo1-like protein [Pseudomonas sp. RIT-PI-S]|uniref:Mpo1 family 2-hydroxy fatty acid dioxygenase n=1 Tax=Pseudomonas sp. RIT-PI-S TaxID=3035295 RepID=UPI0021D8D38B|nr:Mpo1-like protein [Pseudomonas sp. RIT-PI-S]